MMSLFFKEGLDTDFCVVTGSKEVRPEIERDSEAG